MNFSENAHELCVYSAHLEFCKFSRPSTKEMITIRNEAIVDYVKVIIPLYERMQRNHELEKMNDHERTLCDAMYKYAKSLNIDIPVYDKSNLE